MSAPRIVLAGNDAALRHVLQAWRAFRQIECTGVFTDPDRHARDVTRFLGGDVPVKPLAHLAKTSGAEELAALSCDWLVSVGSTVIYPVEVLQAARHGGLNMHPGRLPDYAGLHVHQWAIRHGETSFGATVHWMEPRVDAGDIVFQSQFDIGPAETGLGLYRRCIRSGAELMVEALRCLDDARPLPRIPQDLTRYRVFRSRDATDGRIDWTKPACHIERFVRAADYVPLRSPTYTPSTFLHGTKLYIRRLRVLETPAEAPAEAPAGTIARITPDGPCVVAGDGTGLLITWLEDAQQRRIRNDAFDRWKIVPGVSFTFDRLSGPHFSLTSNTVPSP